LASLTQDAIVV